MNYDKKRVNYDKKRVNYDKNIDLSYIVHILPLVSIF
jgi:hypothetical protein